MAYTPTKIWKTDDPKAPLNRYHNLTNIIEASKGLISNIKLLLDRIVISSKLGSLLQNSELNFS